MMEDEVQYHLTRIQESIDYLFSQGMTYTALHDEIDDMLNLHNPNQPSGFQHP